MGPPRWGCAGMTTRAVPVLCPPPTLAPLAPKLVWGRRGRGRGGIHTTWEATGDTASRKTIDIPRHHRETPKIWGSVPEQAVVERCVPKRPSAPLVLCPRHFARSSAVSPTLPCPRHFAPPQIPPSRRTLCKQYRMIDGKPSANNGSGVRLPIAFRFPVSLDGRSWLYRSTRNVTGPSLVSETCILA